MLTTENSNIIINYCEEKTVVPFPLYKLLYSILTSCFGLSVPRSQTFWLCAQLIFTNYYFGDSVVLLVISELLPPP